MSINMWNSPRPPRRGLRPAAWAFIAFLLFVAFAVIANVWTGTVGTAAFIVFFCAWLFSLQRYAASLLREWRRLHRVDQTRIRLLERETLDR